MRCGIGQTFPRHFKSISFIWFHKWFHKLVLSREAVVQRCSVKKVFLEISQNLQENTCAIVSFLIKLQAWGLQLY